MVRPFRSLLSLIVMLTLFITPLPGTAVASPPFADMTGHWASDVVSQTAALGLVTGYPDGRFRPDNLVTRAEFLKLAVRVRALSLVPGTAGFGDVEGHWVASQGYLQAAVSSGLILPADYGPAGTAPAFEPNRPITRQEVAVIAARVLGKQSAAMVLRGATLPFSDGVPYWAQGFAAVVRSSGIMQGYPDGSFGGERSLTRAEAAAVAVHLLQTAVAEGNLTAPAGLPPETPRSVPVWEANSWRLETVASPARPAGVMGDETDVAAAPDGTLYLAAPGWRTTASGGVGGDPNGNQVWRVAPGSQPVRVYQGSQLGPMAVGADGTLYMADRYQILRITGDGQATPWVGSGLNAFADGQGITTGFQQIQGICADGVGNLYATESGRLRKIDAQGNVSTLAGLTPLQQGALPSGGSGTFSDGPGYLATLPFITGPCAADAAGNVYLAAPNSGAIYRVAPNGTVSWVAGNLWVPGYADGTATEAQFRNITALATDPYGDLWIADAGNQRIRRLTPDGHVYTVAGGGFEGAPSKYGGIIAAYTGGEQDGPGPDARLNNPTSLAVAGGHLYVAQMYGSRLKVINGSSAAYPDGKALAPVPGPGLVPARGQIGETGPGPVTVAFAIFTPVGAVNLQVDDQFPVRSGEPYYTQGWDATAAAPGPHRLQVSASLPDGTVTRGATFTLQVTPGYQTPLSPVHYALITPANGSWLRGVVSIVVAGDNLLQSVSIDGQTVIDARTLVSGRDRILTANWDSTSVADGDHTLDLTHYVPEEGKSFTDHITVHVINRSAPRREDDYGPGLRVYLNGQLHLYTMVPPRMEGDVPYLPFTETLQTLGFQVTFDGSSRTLTATNGSRTATLNIDTGDYTLTPPGTSGTLANKPILVRNLTLAPWDFLANVAGELGAWIPGGQTVRIGPQF